jgi:hypothetical protein
VVLPFSPFWFLSGVEQIKDSFGRVGLLVDWDWMIELIVEGVVSISALTFLNYFNRRFLR